MEEPYKHPINHYKPNHHVRYLSLWRECFLLVPFYLSQLQQYTTPFRTWEGAEFHGIQATPLWENRHQFQKSKIPETNSVRWGLLIQHVVFSVVPSGLPPVGGSSCHRQAWYMWPHGNCPHIQIQSFRDKRDENTCFENWTGRKKIQCWNMLKSNT